MEHRYLSRFKPFLIGLVMLLACLTNSAEAQSVNRLTRPGGLLGPGASSFSDTYGNSNYSSSPSFNSVRLARPLAENASPRPGSLNLDTSVINSFRSNTFYQSARNVPPPTPTFQAGAGSGLWAAPTIAQLKRISDHDVVIAVDKSGSMSEMDCPGDVPGFLQQMFFGGQFNGMVPRWEWCRRQTMHFAEQMARVPGSKMKLVLFDSHVEEFDNVSLNTIAEIFNRYQPHGGTNTTGTLKGPINDYFQRKKMYGRVRPLLIVCITDGAPSSPRSLKDLLVNATAKMESPGEITVVFLQVGNDPEGNRLLPELAYGLNSEGAQFNIVSYRDFGNLLHTGLLNAIVETVSTQAPLVYR